LSSKTIVYAKDYIVLCPNLKLHNGAFLDSVNKESNKSSSLAFGVC